MEKSVPCRDSANNWEPGEQGGQAAPLRVTDWGGKHHGPLWMTRPSTSRSSLITRSAGPRGAGSNKWRQSRSIQRS